MSNDHEWFESPYHRAVWWLDEEVAAAKRKHRQFTNDVPLHIAEKLAAVGRKGLESVNDELRHKADTAMTPKQLDDWAKSMDQTIGEVSKCGNYDIRIRPEDADGGSVIDVLTGKAMALEERVAILEQQDAEAAEYVESVICMRTDFTGDPPYVGWKGLGLALKEALDERDKLKEQLARTCNDANIDGVLDKLVERFAMRAHAIQFSFAREEEIERTKKELKQDILDAFCTIALPYMNENRDLKQRAEVRAEWLPTHRHLKNGGLYRMLYEGMMTEGEQLEVVVYQGQDFKIWVRPREEFYDGRFEPVVP